MQILEIATLKWYSWEDLTRHNKHNQWNDNDRHKNSFQENSCTGTKFVSLQINFRCWVLAQTQCLDLVAHTNNCRRHVSLGCCLILLSNTPQGQLHKDHARHHSHTRSTGCKPKDLKTTITCGATWHTLTGKQDGRKCTQGHRLSIRKSMGGEEGGHEGVTLVRFNQISLTKSITLSQSSKHPRHSFKITHSQCFLCKIQSQQTTNIGHIYRLWTKKRWQYGSNS